MNGYWIRRVLVTMEQRGNAIVEASARTHVERALQAERSLANAQLKSIDQRFEIMKQELDWRLKDMQWHIDFDRKRSEEARQFARGQWFIAAGFVLLVAVMSIYEFLG